MNDLDMSVKMNMVGPPQGEAHSIVEQMRAQGMEFLKMCSARIAELEGMLEHWQAEKRTMIAFLEQNQIQVHEDFDEMLDQPTKVNAPNYPGRSAG